MAIYGVSITKEVNWRGHVEQFANVYHYNFLNLDDQGARQLVNRLIEIERPVHSNEVRFVEGRVWSAGGTPAENDMIGVYDAVAGTTGIAAQNSAMDREACILVHFDTNRQDSRSRKIKLRKWLHTCSPLGAPETFLAGTTPLPANARSVVADYANAVLDPLTGTVTGNLCAPSGADANGSIQVGNWVEHHEFRY